MQFDKAQLPPVHAFWSMIIYDQKNGFAENLEKRYAVRSTDALRYNTDGSLEVYIQRKRPSYDRASNWLPTPEEGPFILNMRLYWPKEDALDGTWAPHAFRTRYKHQNAYTRTS